MGMPVRVSCQRCDDDLHASAVAQWLCACVTLQSLHAATSHRWSLSLHWGWCHCSYIWTCQVEGEHCGQGPVKWHWHVHCLLHLLLLSFFFILLIIDYHDLLCQLLLPPLLPHSLLWTCICAARSIPVDLKHILQHMHQFIWARIVSHVCFPLTWWLAIVQVRLLLHRHVVWLAHTRQEGQYMDVPWTAVSVSCSCMHCIAEVAAVGNQKMTWGRWCQLGLDLSYCCAGGREGKTWRVRGERGMLLMHGMEV